MAREMGLSQTAVTRIWRAFERSLLISLPDVLPELAVWAKAKVHRDAHVQVEVESFERLLATEVGASHAQAELAGYVVPAASHHLVTEIACAGRVRLTEQPVSYLAQAR